LRVQQRKNASTRRLGARWPKAIVTGSSRVAWISITGNLDQLSVALGPNGANKDGALSDLLDTASKNLDGSKNLAMLAVF